MNIALCFCVGKNAQPYLYKIFRNIELLKNSNKNNNIYCVFVYDRCDKNESILKEYQNKNENVIIKKDKNGVSNYRTVRIADVRNMCLDIVYNELPNIIYHIMIDSDDAVCKEWDIGVINNYLNNFDNDDWDCISFNSNNYYDMWALLFEDFKWHCHGFGTKSKTIISIMCNELKNKLNNSISNSIEVISAFNGFCIYKTDRFKGYYYCGLLSNLELLVTENEKNKIKQIFKEKYNMDVECKGSIFNYQVCEHIFYNFSAFNDGRKIKISKFLLLK